MRFPHRVRISDPRNRQPPEGVAYDAKLYDLLRIAEIRWPRDATEETILPQLSANNVEPDGITSPFFDVPALVTMTNDGDNNNFSTTFSIRVPIKEYRQAKNYLNGQREVSIKNYGYQQDGRAREEFRVYTLGLPSNPAISSLPSSYLVERVNFNQAFIGPVPGEEDPFSERFVPGQLYYALGLDDIDFEGVIPPVKEWDLRQRRIDPDSLLSRPSPGWWFFQLRGTVSGGGARIMAVRPESNYPAGLFIRRFDAYEDMVELRCEETLNFL